MSITPDDVFTPMERWGRDHWSTLLYLETRCVDHRGILNGAHMRGRDPQYPTRLAGGGVIEMHSDWDCLDDMRHAGLVVPCSAKGVQLKDRNGIRRHWAEVEAWALTDYGWLVASAQRRHRAEGGRDGTFSPPERPT